MNSVEKLKCTKITDRHIKKQLNNVYRNRKDEKIFYTLKLNF